MRDCFKCENANTGETCSVVTHSEELAAIHFAEELDGLETVLIRVKREFIDDAPTKTFLVERRMEVICKAKEITNE